MAASSSSSQGVKKVQPMDGPCAEPRHASDRSTIGPREDRIRALRTKYPGTTTDELVQIWIDRLKGRASSDITYALGDEIEEMATVNTDKFTACLQLFATTATSFGARSNPR